MRHYPILRPFGAALLLSLACAEASAPLPPAEEVLLVVNSTEASLQIIPVDAPTSSIKVPLGGTTPSPVGVSARGGWAIVPMGLDNSVVVVDLTLGVVERTIPLAANSGATGSAVIDDSIAYVANPGLNTVTRINYLTGDTASVDVGVYPQAVIAARGKVFVINGNLVNFTPAGSSWLTVIDPATNQRASGTDSIPLPGPGNAGFGEEAGDGLLYIMNTGPYDGVTPGRISTVDPVSRTELGSFGGFGTAPGPIATNGTDRLYISSYSEGLMVYDVIQGEVLRGAGDGVAIANNSAVSVDSEGRIYALETGPCTGGTPGTIHILRRDLSEIRQVDAGECPVGAVITEIPPTP
ncbi:MAG: hypothetical protein OEW80_03715 [Gemmatimonadota bacterium]|nr:hypothetical protein [Gemmatimonadota bacterium]